MSLSQIRNIILVNTYVFYSVLFLEHAPSAALIGTAILVIQTSRTGSLSHAFMTLLNLVRSLSVEIVVVVAVGCFPVAAPAGSTVCFVQAFPLVVLSGAVIPLVRVGVVGLDVSA